MIPTPDMPSIDFAFASDTGLVREHNLDRVICQGNICLVADAMGQKQHEKQASSIVIDVVLTALEAGLELSDAIKKAHETLMQENFNGSSLASDGFVRQDFGQRPFGSTVVACQLSKNGYKVAWVGDSRAYLWNPVDATLLQLTEDHSLVNRWVKQGQLTPKMAFQHPKRHVMTQCLGLSQPSKLQIDARSGYLLNGQIIMLCSDGLTNAVSDKSIASILHQDDEQPADLQTTAQALIDEANRQGGQDNVSVSLARLTNKM